MNYATLSNCSNQTPYKILNLSNLYVHQTFPTIYNVNIISRDNFLVKLPSVRLNVSQYNFVSRCSLIWNKFIGKVEPTTRAFDPAIEHAIANDVTAILQKPSKPISNLKRHLSKALQTLRQKRLR